MRGRAPSPAHCALRACTPPTSWRCVDIGFFCVALFRFLFCFWRTLLPATTRLGPETNVVPLSNEGAAARHATRHTPLLSRCLPAARSVFTRASMCMRSAPCLTTTLKRSKMSGPLILTPCKTWKRQAFSMVGILPVSAAADAGRVHRVGQGGAACDHQAWC